MPYDTISLAHLRACLAALSPERLQKHLRPRTVALGPFWARFETPETLLWQLAQTAHTEGIEDDDALQAECDVYATLVPDDCRLVTLGHAGATGSYDGSASASAGVSASVSDHTAAWRSALAALPAGFQVTCGAQNVQPTSVTPMGAVCQVLLPMPQPMRACFAAEAAVVHCQLQTFVARLPEGLRRAL